MLSFNFSNLLHIVGDLFVGSITHANPTLAERIMHDLPRPAPNPRDPRPLRGSPSLSALTSNCSTEPNSRRARELWPDPARLACDCADSAAHLVWNAGLFGARQTPREVEFVKPRTQASFA
jgi:hypothetical protein